MDLHALWAWRGPAAAMGVLALFLLHRLALVFYVRRSMFARSGRAGGEQPGDRCQPQREVSAPSVALTQWAVNVPEWEAHRVGLAAARRGSLNRRALAGVLAATGYALLPPLIGLFDGALNTRRWGDVAQMAWVLLCYVGLGYWLNRRLFVPRDGITWSSMPGQVAIGLRLARAGLNPPWELLVACVVAIGALEAVLGTGDPFVWASYSHTGAPGFLIGILLAMLLHVGLIVASWFIHDHLPGPKLLVLRVFGPAKAAGLIFDKLASSWSRYGSYLTIDDPGFARHRYRVLQFGTLATAFVTLFFAASSGLLALGVVGLIAARDWYGLTQRGPARDVAEASRRIERVLTHPWRIDGRHTDLRMVAYMDLWKVVVQRFVAVADVVLFDLRGYRDSNQGSAWEVGCLLDTFPLDRVVFLIADTDGDAVEAMLQRAARTLWTSSPNAAGRPQALRIVRIHEADPGAGACALLDHLLYAARRPAV